MIAQLNDMAQIWWQWMGSMFWQVSLLIIIVTALDMGIRKWAWPQVRYALWALVFIKLIIPPTWEMPTSIISWTQPQVEEQISVRIGISDEIINGGEIISPKDEGNKAGVEVASWKTWLLSGWISGMFIFSLLLIRKMIQFRKWYRQRVKEDIPEWHNELMVTVAKKLKLNKIPAVVFSKDVKSPAVYGITKPYLILPEGYMEKLSKEQAEHVLIHELCHLKRGDLQVHWFCILIQIVYWFNPLLIWARRQMRYICEICCDLSVANILREKTGAYRDTLLKTARELFAENMEPSLGFLGIFEEPFRLVPRLKWLEKKSWENRKRRITTTICSTLFMVVCVMPMAGISQTSDYSYDEINSNQAQEEIEIKSQDTILYKMLIMEADIDKDIFGRTPEDQEVIGMAFHAFTDGINIDGESFEDLEELFGFMDDDPDVKVLSFPRIITAKGSTATMSAAPSADSSMPDIQLKILPINISENNYITQNIELEVVEVVDEEDPARNLIKNINTMLITKDGDIVLVTGITIKDTSSSESIGKNLYVFITPHILEKSSTEDENIVLQNSDEKPRMVQIDMDNIDIKHFIKLISELTGKNFIVGKDVKGKVTLMTPTKLTVDEAYKVFESVLEVNGYTTVPAGNAIKIVTADPGM